MSRARGQVRQVGQAGQRRRASRVGPVRRMLASLVLLIAVFGSAIIYAGPGGGEGENVTLTVGRSFVLDTGHPIARVSLTSADVADALVTSSNELLINGKTPGTISMFVWDRAGAIRRYEVVVQRDLARLSEQLKEFFPNESISAQNNGRSIVLAGTVTGKDVIDRAVMVAAGYVEKKDDVVSLMQVQAGRSNQVLLHVRFAEVSRNALTELGSAFALNGYKDGRYFARSTTEQFPAPQWDKDGKFVFSDFLNLFLYDSKEGIAGVVRALTDKGLFQSLAEPNVVAESGKEASFLAGGEIPIPIAQPSNGTVALTISYKEFGIRLNFTPIVNGNRVHLKVKPEVSTLDYANAVTLQGFRIPAFTTRRTETELELDNNQTFSIAGLLNNTMNSSLQKIPGIGDIPILGLLFKSKAAQKGQTELVVMITPEILPNGSTGVTNELPRLIDPFMPPAKKTMEPPPPAFSGVPGSRTAADSPSVAPSASMPVSTPPTMPAPAVTAPAMPVAPAVAPAPAAAPAPVVPAPAARPAPVQQPDAKAQAAEAKRQAQVVEESRRRAEQQKKEGDEQKKRDDQAAREQAKRDAKTAAEQARHDEQAKKDQAKRDEQAAREQLKRDSEAARKQAEIDKAAADAAAKRAAEEAKQQAEIEKKKQKSLDEAEARLRAAEAAYQAELAKRGTRNP